MGQDDITALMEASIMGHKDIASYLIKKGAVVDSPAASGVTALWLAAGEGRHDIVQMLIDQVISNHKKELSMYLH